ncbi:type II toxin-antitoxin system RelE/ParE family toxin [Acidiferrobacter sp.]|uniref:type II toxin-antitoxin system RelE/ParE family toxin n=1 Tax=Acidiferrobacter sp. TaxID=1872107 RepID=UPI002623C487|nr:type II toxin-antitoxin system RelE/ParE family toxin [Acidiferrobacter sp.]
MVKLSEAAARDIEDILERSIEEFGVRQAETCYAALSQCRELLAANPEMGSAAQDIRPRYRRFPHERHVIFYTLDPDGPLVVRILHQRMDIAKNFAR